jgi:hypothetical protein
VVTQRRKMSRLLCLPGTELRTVCTVILLSAAALEQDFMIITRASLSNQKKNK